MASGPSASDPVSEGASEPPELHYSPITYGGRASMSSTSTKHNMDERQPSRGSTHAHKSPTKEHRDPNLDITLPYRTLTPNANMAEYTTEDPRGEIPVARAATAQKPDEPSAQNEQYKLVTFVPNDPENPKNWSKLFRWYCTLVVALTCFVVAFCSSVITADIAGVVKEFNVSEEVALLSISVFVVGFGIGPMAFAPLSEIYGRRII